MPRDFTIVSARFRSPSCTMYDTWIQVSAIVEMPVAVASSMLRPSISEVFHDGDLLQFEKIQEVLRRVGGREGARLSWTAAAGGSMTRQRGFEIDPPTAGGRRKLIFDVRAAGLRVDEIQTLPDF